MHDKLFKMAAIVDRYRAGPYVEARERFLRQASADGYSRSMLERVAWVLLTTAKAVQSQGGSISSAAAEELARPTSPVGQRAATIGTYSKLDPSFRRGLAAQHRSPTA